MSVPQTSAEEEHRHHTYTSNVIPWYVRLIWALFWVFAISYAIKYLLRAAAGNDAEVELRQDG